MTEQSISPQSISPLRRRMIEAAYPDLAFRWQHLHPSGPLSTQNVPFNQMIGEAGHHGRG